MSKRGAAERDFTPSQGNLRKARVEIRRVDAFQVLMAAARARNSAPQQPNTQQAATETTGAAPGAPAAASAGAPGAPGPQVAGPPTVQAVTAPTAPCTHCGTVLPVSADSCSLRQCCACLDVFCSLCSVLDYEEREDRVFCLSCLEDQAAASRTHNRGGRGATAGPGSAATAGLALGLSMPVGGAAGRWGQLDMLGVGGPVRSPFPCGSRTPQHGQAPGSRTPGSAIYSSRSHRGFSALLGYAGAET